MEDVTVENIVQKALNKIWAECILVCQPSSVSLSFDRLKGKKILIDALKEAEHRGWCDCLDSVRASIEGYPYLGGDIEIMKAVEKLLKESVY